MRYPMRVYQDPEDPGYWIAHIPNLGGGEVGLLAQGRSAEEARAEAPVMLAGYVLSKWEARSPLEAEPGELPRGEGWEWVAPSPRVEVALAIRAAREEAKLSQAEAAKLLGVAQTTYTKWEQPGKCNATLSTLEKVARIFGRRVQVSLV